MSQEEKVQLESEKLKLEIRELRRPVFLKIGFWVSLVSIGVAVYQTYRSDYEYKLAELKKAMAERDLRQLEDRKREAWDSVAAMTKQYDELQASVNQLKDQREKLQKDTAESQQTVNKLAERIRGLLAKSAPAARMDLEPLNREAAELMTIQAERSKFIENYGKLVELIDEKRANLGTQIRKANETLKK